MLVKKFAEEMEMTVLSGGDELDKDISGVYVCDLLSWVMSKANKGDAWITVLTNLNVVAVATLTEVACVIIPEGIVVDEAILRRADAEGIVILGSQMNAYEICCKAQRLIEG